MALVAPAQLQEWVTRLACALGYRAADAEYLADSLVDANLRGVDSHGVIRLPIYAQRIAGGLVEPLADLGTDVIAELTITTGARLACVARHRLPPGTGPRHLVARDSWLYVAGELDSRVHGLSRRDDGYQWQWSLPSYDPEQSIACDTNDPSHIQLSADRAHLYVANRGRHTIGVFKVGPDGGIKLVQERATEGHWPRHFTIRGDRLYVANQLSHRVCVFAVQHAAIGELLQSVDIASPACLLVA